MPPILPWQKSATFGSDVRCVIGMLQGSFGYNLELIVERLDFRPLVTTG